MRLLLTPEQMYALEREHFERAGESQIDLMERAGRCVFGAALDIMSGAVGKRVVAVCGAGNNGGDGCIAARLLREAGAEAAILPLCPRESLKGAALEVRARAERGGVEILGEWECGAARTPDLWIDAAFGIGLNRPLDARYGGLFDIIEKSREGGAKVLAVDVPSGINALTGKIEGRALRADVTVAFHALKLGCALGDGLEYSGRARVADIGIALPPPVDAAALVEASDARALFGERRRNTHKGDYGHLLIVAGSRGMAGAAALAALAALRTGAGLVTVACPESVVPTVQILAPCAMTAPMPEEDGALSSRATEPLAALISGKDAVAIGPGLSRRASALAVKCALECGLPAVVDADALNIIAERAELRGLLETRHVLTPHPGEAKRLLSEDLGAVEAARAIRAMGPVALVKGASTVICGPGGTYVSASGCAGMATGGSGDVLTGMIGALLARRVDCETAAWAASELHGRAGEAASARLTDVGMTAMDIAAHIPTAIREMRQ